MWSAMHSPLRGLDEFDVFMDAVNRRISVRLIVSVNGSRRNRSISDFCIDGRRQG